MPAPDISALVATVTAVRGTVKSATAVIEGIGARLQAVRDEMAANGVTSEQLKPLTDEITALDEDENALAVAVAANP